MNSLPLNSPPSPHSTNTNQEPTVNNQITTNKKENIRVNDWSTHAQLDKLIKTISSNSPSSIRDEFESLLIIYPTSLLEAKIDIEKNKSKYQNQNVDSIIDQADTESIIIDDSSSFSHLESLFSRALGGTHPILDVKLWHLYVNHVRKKNQSKAWEENSLDEEVLLARQSIMKAFELALQSVGYYDVGSIIIWNDFLEFVKGIPAPSTYEQQQQMEQIRKIYNRLVSIPMNGLESIWHEYDSFENNLNKLTAKKILAERNGPYMLARAHIDDLKEMIMACDRSSLSIPSSFDPRADDRLAAWGKWIVWEKGNPLKIQDASLLSNRIIYAYKCALQSLRHYPEIWIDFAVYLGSIGNNDEAISCLNIASFLFPRSILVTGALSELYELQNKYQEAKSVYERALTSLESQITRDIEDLNVTTIKGNDASISNSNFIKTRDDNVQSSNSNNIDDTDKISNDQEDNDPSSIGPLVTHLFVEYMNLARRTDGINASRGLFSRARKLPSEYIGYELYVVAARIEYHCKKDPIVAGKIYELGMTKYGNQTAFILAYADHLVHLNDEQNTRGLFERALLQVKAENAFDIWRAYLEYETQYGDLTTILGLEKRFKQAYPNDPNSNDTSLLYRRHTIEMLKPIDEKIWQIALGVDPPRTTRPTIPQFAYLTDIQAVAEYSMTTFYSNFSCPISKFSFLSKEREMESNEFKEPQSRPKINIDALLKVIISFNPTKIKKSGIVTGIVAGSGSGISSSTSKPFHSGKRKKH